MEMIFYVRITSHMIEVSDGLPKYERTFTYNIVCFEASYCYTQV